jgi:hypothetical protein
MLVQPDDDAGVEPAVREPQYVIGGADTEVDAAAGEGLDGRAATTEIQELGRDAFGFEEALIIRHPHRQKAFVHRRDAEFERRLGDRLAWQREAERDRCNDGKSPGPKPVCEGQVVTHGTLR